MVNWQQKLSKSITGIKGVDRNIARLTICIDSLDVFGTKPPLIIELHRELIVAGTGQHLSGGQKHFQRLALRSGVSAGEWLR